ncbi:MAG: PilN domain-containing protein [Candidatus Roizmanbacteria bacterium]|nr:PilN domain-containing protein [Candidatus Roizmanbacteria bacterium]
MPKVNLLPKEELETKPFGRFLKWALSYGRYIIVSVELIVFLVFFSRFIYDRELADINDKIEQKQAIIASAQEFENRFRAVQDHISYVETLDENRRIYLEILDTLERTTPVQVSFNTVSFSEESLTLEGFAVNNESFAQLLAQLKTIDTFTSISLDSLTEDEENEDILEFTLTISFEKVEPVIPSPEDSSGTENLEVL